jgi:hypothetical protein
LSEGAPDVGVSLRLLLDFRTTGFPFRPLGIVLLHNRVDCQGVELDFCILFCSLPTWSTLSFFGILAINRCPVPRDKMEIEK